MNLLKKLSLLILILNLSYCYSYTQPVQRNIRTSEYKALQEKLCKGWNTWYNNSVITHALLPEGFSINLCFAPRNNMSYLRDALQVSKSANRPENVLLGLRADDGSYTSLKLQYSGIDVAIETATEGDDELILVSPSKSSDGYLEVEGGLLWNKEGTIGMMNNQIKGSFPSKEIIVSSTEKPIINAYSVSNSPRLSFMLKGEIGIFTGKHRTLDEVKQAITKSKEIQQKRVDGYGDLAESFKAMQNILAWNTIYDAPNNRVITPVSRRWNQNAGGLILFEWDTYFASFMLSLFNKELAYANAIEITKTIMPNGLLPNFQKANNYKGVNAYTSWDRTEPPIGSLVIWNIYKKYKEKWFLEEVYDELLAWNRWMYKNRANQIYLSWGSDWIEQEGKEKIDKKYGSTARRNAILESGLDNSPMYDSARFNKTTHTLELADVGLISLYIEECQSLIEISKVIGKTADVKELESRAKQFTSALQTLWSDKAGIYLNKYTNTDSFSYRLSPTNFYPLLAKACTPKQAERMIKEHFYNPNEFYGEYIMPSIARNDPAFKDNYYWRGRIWGPMNFLVYLGMTNYDLKDARTELINKSKNLLMKNWKENGGVYENYNATDGKGYDVGSSDGFYHWGALLTFMEFIEKGYFK